MPTYAPTHPPFGEQLKLLDLIVAKCRSYEEAQVWWAAQRTGPMPPALAATLHDYFSEREPMKPGPLYICAYCLRRVSGESCDGCGAPRSTR